ncbi:MAG: type II toxin-antitoxin system RelE/ParE family toxin [Candidatus Pacearchaeota archaeon]|jgi:mRNA-degrading endonuclease RelE of RelBE toxin-antitoxin system
MVNVIFAEHFKKVVLKLDNSIKAHLEKIIYKIKENPEMGKPMRFDRKETREVYVSPFRLSYFYDKKQDTLYFLDFYHKDKQ